MLIRIIGTGAMGIGIAHVFAAAGHSVEVADLTVETAEAGVNRLAVQLDRQVEKGRLTEAEKSRLLGQIRVVSEDDDVSETDLLLEAVSETTALKRAIFEAYDTRCKGDCIFATNTSSLSITELAAGLSHAGRFLGMHFFNPPPVMKLVEVISGEETSAETVSEIAALCEQLGKTPVTCREAPGFIVNRLLIPMLNEACNLLEEQVAGRDDIDAAMKLGANHPMGPLALADLFGLVICLNIMETLFLETGDPKFRPSVLLRKMVRAGKLGRKTKRGFYDYG